MTLTKQGRVFDKKPESLININEFPSLKCGLCTKHLYPSCFIRNETDEFLDIKNYFINSQDGSIIPLHTRCKPDYVRNLNQDGKEEFLQNMVRKAVDVKKNQGSKSTTPGIRVEPLCLSPKEFTSLDCGYCGRTLNKRSLKNGKVPASCYYRTKDGELYAVHSSCKPSFLRMLGMRVGIRSNPAPIVSIRDIIIPDENNQIKIPIRLCFQIKIEVVHEE